MFHSKTLLIQVGFLSTFLGATQVHAEGGDVAWTLKQATITTDSYGHMFSQSYYPTITFAAIDRKSGQDVWTHAAAQTLYANSSCNDSDKVFVVSDGKLEALNPLTGALVWSGPALEDSATFYCEANFGSLVLTSGYPNTVLRLVDKVNGQLQWKFEGGGSVSYTTKDDQNIYLQKFENNAPTVIALNRRTGALRWSRHLSQGDWAFNDAKSRMFIGTKNGYEKLDKGDGHTVWTVAGNGSDDYLGLQTFKNGVMLAQQGTNVRRLNPETGAVLWQYDLPAALDDRTQSTSYLTDGQLVVDTFDKVNKVWTFTVMNDQGQPKWERKGDEPTGILIEDSKGNLFIKGGDSLSALNKETGAVLWTFVRENADVNQSIFSFDTYGNDIIISYGVASGRYPPMGLIRLDAKTGRLQWDKWINETLSVITADDQFVFTQGPMGSKIISYER